MYIGRENEIRYHKKGETNSHTLSIKKCDSNQTSGMRKLFKRLINKFRVVKYRLDQSDNKINCTSC